MNLDDFLNRPFKKRNAVLFGMLIGLILFVLLSALYGWDGSGLGAHTTPDGEYQKAKTLWDWFDLFIVPLILAVGVALINMTIRRVDREREADRQQEQALQNYYDHMSELLLQQKLGSSQFGDDVRSVALTRTLSTLQRLDPKRKGQLLRFLYDAGLIGKWNLEPLRKRKLSTDIVLAWCGSD